MNKRILISLSVIAAVAVLAIGGTVAYFSDVETSTGNTFTAGSIDLKIDLARDGVRIFDLKDLDPTDKLFNYSDIKPGDSGELTISAHVYNNDACGRFRIYNIVDDDVSCPEPESEVGDTSCGSGKDGELDDHLMSELGLIGVEM
jgi:predicted ribosomally synthesized peptide with SipW-like signal peptide